MSTYYEPSQEKIVLTQEEIRERYQDTALIIYRKHQKKRKIVNYLSFGNRCKVMDMNNDNTGYRHQTTGTVDQSRRTLTSQILRIYHKPSEGCTIS